MRHRRSRNEIYICRDSSYPEIKSRLEIYHPTTDEYRIIRNSKGYSVSKLIDIIEEKKDFWNKDVDENDF